MDAPSKNMDYSLMKKKGGSKGQEFPGQVFNIIPKQLVAQTERSRLSPEWTPVSSGYFPTAGSHYVDREQPLNEAVIKYCIAGLGWAELNGHRVAVPRGSVLCIFPGTPHSYGANEQDPWTILWTHIRHPFARKILQNIGFSAERPVIETGVSSRLQALLREIVDTHRHTFSMEELRYTGSLAGAALNLIPLLARRRKTSGNSEERVTDVVRQLPGMMHRTIRIPELSRMAGLSDSHFSMVFKNCTGCSVMEYIERLRLQFAQELLDTTDLPVQEIAGRIGMEDPLYFSRRFRKLYGASPRHYRLQQKG